MAQLAPVLIPLALQAATTALQQYQQQEAAQRQQAAQAQANRAQAEAARQQAEAQARQVADGATLANQAAWQDYDIWAARRRADSDAAISALNTGFARTEMERAEALRRDNAARRARFASQGLDGAAGSAAALLMGLNQAAADQTRRDHDDLGRRTAELYDTANADIAGQWEVTASETAARSHQTDLDLWQRQVALDSRLHQLGVQQAARRQQDLLDLTVSHQRAALGLAGSGGRAVGQALSGGR
ncbi:hypothetical protein [Roseospira navarrensis]|uniref:Uncharacterized protein n=1 Tax=Roseospira navarrensis TaxID=140058 RepID=A0A7X1ZBH6_9PROT|nr:hypothetical protein [Roseospira navarrensis]MQX35474.1 hypothetical protein [Roseospira navarrensis]